MSRTPRLVRAAVGLAVALLAPSLLAAPATAAPGGSPASFAVRRVADHTGTQAVVRWNPCTAITYKLNPGALGAAGLAELQRGVDMAARASGLSFRSLGTTRFVPRFKKDGSGGSEHEGALQRLTGAQLVIGYATSRETDWFRGAGGTAQLSYSSGPGSPLQVSQAVAFVRSDVRMPAGYGRGGRGALVLHEIGHALGLQHVTERQQTMYPVVLPDRLAEYHRGDLAGLRAVGRAAGCIPTPTAAPGALSVATVPRSSSHQVPVP
jgi:hypothetical protein